MGVIRFAAQRFPSQPWTLAALATVLLAFAVAGASSSHANWLSRIVREAAESGGGTAVKAGKLGAGALDTAAAHVAALPKLAGGTSLAAHLTPEGHWKFANREGVVFTAGTPDELARFRSALAPEATTGDKLALYLSEETVFARPHSLADLPHDADLFVVAGDDAFRLRRTGDGLAAEISPALVVPATDRELFGETVYRLSRPLNRSNIRALALEGGGPRQLSSAPRYDPATRAALVDQVDPSALPQALAGIRGQTALISGRIEGITLAYRASSGPERTLDVTTLVKAAEDADVNLVLLNTGSARQPGGRNWLWQKVAVAGLDDALKRATLADFLGALGGSGSELSIAATRSALGRITFSAVPAPSASAPLTDTLGSWVGWDNWIGEFTGHMAVKAVEVFARDEAQERELEQRIFAGIPSSVQFFYLGSLVMGVLAWPVTSHWWSRIWPREQRREYAGRLGLWAARAVRLLAFLLLFLPLAGLPALLWFGTLNVWYVLTAPLRFLGWIRDRLSPRRA